MDDTVRFFTYGTLKRGQVRHDILTDFGADFEGEAVLPGYSLYHVPGGGFPAMVPDPVGQVRGELYEIPKTLVSYLDRVEGHPVLYVRTEVVMDDGEPAITYVWNQSIEGLPFVGEEWPPNN